LEDCVLVGYSHGLAGAEGEEGLLVNVNDTYIVRSISGIQDPVHEILPGYTSRVNFPAFIGHYHLTLKLVVEVISKTILLVDVWDELVREDAVDDR
tara:strand:+ start:180 stop:467 length:288 start_codon:yes stop_codon:yes gene_type:complete